MPWRRHGRLGHLQLLSGCQAGLAAGLLRWAQAFPSQLLLLLSLPRCLRLVAAAALGSSRLVISVPALRSVTLRLIDLDNFYDTVKNFCQSHWTVVSSSNGYRWKEEEKDRLERRRRREQGEFRKKTNRSKVNVGMRKNCRGEKDFICSLYSPSGAANWTKGQPRHTITLLTDNSAEERSSPK